MSDTQVYIVFFAFVLVQISAFRKRWQIPLFRGADWFLGVHVTPDFYAGPGQAILRLYRFWTFAPYAVEALAILAILRFGRPSHLLYLAIAMVFVVVPNSIISAMVCTKKARPYEIPGTNRPVSSVMLSLKTRRFEDYTNRGLEYVLAFVNVVTVAILAVAWRNRAAFFDWREFLGRPLLLFYVQIGLLLAKRALVGWRTVAPSEDAEAYLAWREHSRRYWVDVCDSVRAITVAQLALLAARLVLDWPNAIVVALSLILMGAWVIWYTRRRDAFLEIARRTRPVKLPHSLDGEAGPAGIVCYRPERPVLLVKRADGYSLNLASRRAQVGALYFAGLIVIVLALFTRIGSAEAANASLSVPTLQRGL